MKQHLTLLSITLAMATTLATAQMRPGTLGQPGGTGQGQHIPGVGEPGMGGTSGIPGQDQQKQQQTSTARVDDSVLERELHDQFSRNPDMANVQVQVEKGVVTLEGSVPTKDDRKKAKQIAESVPGVRKVREKLEVKPGGASAGMSSNSLGVSAGADTTGNAEQQNNTAGSIAGNTTAASGTQTGTSAMGQAGASTSTEPSMNPGTTPSTSSPATTEPNNAPPSTPPISSNEPGGAASSGSVASTGGVSGSAIAGLQAPTSSATSGNVGAASGSPAATRSGGSATEQNSGQSEEGASGSFMTVPDGASLRGQIQTSFQNDPTLANQNININVTRDTIELSGAVPSGKQKQTARRIADSYAAGRKVVDHMTVGGSGQEVKQGNSADAPGSGKSNASTSMTGAPTGANSGPAAAGPTTGTTSGSATGTGNSTTGTPTPPQTNPPRS